MEFLVQVGFQEALTFFEVPHCYPCKRPSELPQSWLGCLTSQTFRRHISKFDQLPVSYYCLCSLVLLLIESASPNLLTVGPPLAKISVDSSESLVCYSCLERKPLIQNIINFNRHYAFYITREKGGFEKFLNFLMFWHVPEPAGGHPCQALAYIWKSRSWGFYTIIAGENRVNAQFTLPVSYNYFVVFFSFRITMVITVI